MAGSLEAASPKMGCLISRAQTQSDAWGGAALPIHGWCGSRKVAHSAVPGVGWGVGGDRAASAEEPARAVTSSRMPFAASRPSVMSTPATTNSPPTSSQASPLSPL